MGNGIREMSLLTISKEELPRELSLQMVSDDSGRGVSHLMTVYQYNPDVGEDEGKLTEESGLKTQLYW